jgi:hypothetical protein
MVLAAVTVSKNVSTLPFFPLTVEYREKTYAAGKIPGGFLKREGRPSDKEILAARGIDRSIRPLFPEGYKDDVQCVITVLSTDQENDPDILGTIAASAALTISEILAVGKEPHPCSFPSSGSPTGFTSGSRRRRLVQRPQAHEPHLVMEPLAREAPVPARQYFVTPPKESASFLLHDVAHRGQLRAGDLAVSEEFRVPHGDPAAADQGKSQHRATRGGGPAYSRREW